MDIHQSVPGYIVTPKTAVKYIFPEDFLEISQSSKMWTAAEACLAEIIDFKDDFSKISEHLSAKSQVHEYDYSSSHSVRLPVRKSSVIQ